MSNNAEKIEGVFYVEKVAKIGTGHTEKKVKQRMFCLAKQVGDDEVEFCYLGANDEPMGEPEVVPKKDFIHKFVFQPYYFEKKKAEQEKQDGEKDKKVNKQIALAEKHVEKNELYSAEHEYKVALKIDEQNLRANFGIGNVYLKMGERDKAKDIFAKISKIDAIFEEKNKHFFNECGIQLRKQKLYDEAIDYYEKAVKLSPDDENLYFNLARPCCESGNIERAQEVMYKALEINPKFKEGKALLNYIAEKKAEQKLQPKQDDGAETAEAPAPDDAQQASQEFFAKKVD
ncbi:MAG: tetratricopeptide repeat protein [Deltaproteobacteria bacterium]|nr:tetratricopeptide repeat protein [Deltaproteobacteria bacterium]